MPLISILLISLVFLGTFNNLVEATCTLGALMIKDFGPPSSYIGSFHFKITDKDEIFVMVTSYWLTWRNYVSAATSCCKSFRCRLSITTALFCKWSKVSNRSNSQRSAPSQQEKCLFKLTNKAAFSVLCPLIQHTENDGSTEEV